MKDPLKMVQDCIDNNEPVFVLRGRDRFASMAVAYYRDKTWRDDSIKPEFKQEMLKISQEFRNFQMLFNAKTPD